MTEECERLADAIMRGGSLDVLVGRLQERQARADTLKRALVQVRPAAALSAHSGLEGRIRKKLADWRGLLARNVSRAREVLQALLVEPLRFTPLFDEHRRGYRFTGAIALERPTGLGCDRAAKNTDW